MACPPMCLSGSANEYGPEKICYVHEPRVGMRGIVVIDNTAAGPAIGGIRMAPDVTTEEVFRLARAMTWKNALAGLPHGGGKAGIVADPKAPNKETLIRNFARSMESLRGYIPGPDMGTDETAMAWVRDEIGRSVGLSKVLGGIPLDQIGATGYGLAICGEVIQEFSEVKLEGGARLHPGIRQRRPACGSLSRGARREAGDGERPRRDRPRPRRHRRRETHRAEADDGACDRLREGSKAPARRFHRPRVRHLHPGRAAPT